ncbi:MAG: hypothetical protein ACIARR_06715, partial [Phycisphaerales bacterium JB059]
MRPRTCTLLVLVMGASLCGCAAQTRSPEADTAFTSKDRQGYRDALDEMMEADQRYRTAISWGTTDERELARLEALDDESSMAELMRRRSEGVALDPDVEKRLWEQQIAIDRENTRRLMDLVDRYGWPNERRPGGEFSDPVPILIHMRMDDAAWVL